jgi:hypothetical protein
MPNAHGETREPFSGTLLEFLFGKKRRVQNRLNFHRRCYEDVLSAITMLSQAQTSESCTAAAKAAQARQMQLEEGLILETIAEYRPCTALGQPSEGGGSWMNGSS